MSLPRLHQRFSFLHISSCKHRWNHGAGGGLPSKISKQPLWFRKFLCNFFHMIFQLLFFYLMPLQQKISDLLFSPISISSLLRHRKQCHGALSFSHVLTIVISVCFFKRWPGRTLVTCRLESVKRGTFHHAGYFVSTSNVIQFPASFLKQSEPLELWSYAGAAQLKWLDRDCEKALD